jgi:hypothetical protein
VVVLPVHELPVADDVEVVLVKYLRDVVNQPFPVRTINEEDVRVHDFRRTVLFYFTNLKGKTLHNTLPAPH